MSGVRTERGCSFENCTGVAHARPVLELWGHATKGARINWSTTPMLVELPGVTVCEAHAKTATAQDFLTDETWASMAAEFKSLKTIGPTRHMTKLKLVQP